MCLSKQEPRRCANLPPVEAVLLWAMRAWVIGTRRRVPVEATIDEVLARIGAINATGQVYGFMWAVSHGASRTLEVACVCNPRVSSDECRLLAALALAQRGRTHDALVLLRTMLAADTAGAALDSALKVTGSFTAVGRFLSPCWTSAGTLGDRLEPDPERHPIAMTVH